jgi:hypothetical protein
MKNALAVGTTVAAEYMYESDSLSYGEVIYSDDGNYKVQWVCPDAAHCVLVQYHFNGSSWVGRAYVFGEHIALFDAPRVEMYTGNFVMLDGDGYPYGMSNTGGDSSNWLAVQNDGNIVVYDGYGTPLWTPACEFPWISQYQTLFPFNINNCP